MGQVKSHGVLNERHRGITTGDSTTGEVEIGILKCDHGNDRFVGHKDAPNEMSSRSVLDADDYPRRSHHQSNPAVR
jgi:hypothetical protein